MIDWALLALKPIVYHYISISKSLLINDILHIKLKKGMNRKIERRNEKSRTILSTSSAAITRVIEMITVNCNKVKGIIDSVHFVHEFICLN